MQLSAIAIMHGTLWDSEMAASGEHAYIVAQLQLQRKSRAAADKRFETQLRWIQEASPLARESPLSIGEAPRSFTWVSSAITFELLYKETPPHGTCARGGPADSPPAAWQRFMSTRRCLVPSPATDINQCARQRIVRPQKQRGLIPRLASGTDDLVFGMRVSLINVSLSGAWFCPAACMSVSHTVVLCVRN